MNNEIKVGGITRAHKEEKVGGITRAHKEEKVGGITRAHKEESTAKEIVIVDNVDTGSFTSEEVHELIAETLYCATFGYNDPNLHICKKYADAWKVRGFITSKEYNQIINL